MGMISTLIGNKKAMFALITVILITGVYYWGSVTPKPLMTPQQFDIGIENGTIVDYELVYVTGTVIRIITPTGSGGIWYKLNGSDIPLWTADGVPTTGDITGEMDYELQLMTAAGDGQYKTGFTYAWIISTGPYAKPTYW